MPYKTGVEEVWYTAQETCNTIATVWPMQVGGGNIRMFGLTLYMARTRTHSRCMYSQNRLNMTRIPYFLLGSAYSTCRVKECLERRNAG